MGQLEDEFGDIIKKARTGLGLALKELAEKTGISSELLEQVENYKYCLSEQELKVLAEELELSVPKLSISLNSGWQPAEAAYDEIADVIIIKGAIGSYKVNSYILMDKKNGVAVAFDTGNNSNKMLQSVKDNGVELAYVFLTHGHSDHTGGLNEVCRRTGAAIGFPEAEAETELAPEIRKKVFFVKDGSDFKSGVHVIRAVATPGHTPGSTCYLTGKYCFSGDTLFAGSVGGAYSTEGYKSLLNSVRAKILSQHDSVFIFPGHGTVTTVGDEIMHNPFF